jgi:hypothetical protein
MLHKFLTGSLKEKSNPLFFNFSLGVKNGQLVISHRSLCRQLKFLKLFLNNIRRTRRIWDIRIFGFSKPFKKLLRLFLTDKTFKFHFGDEYPGYLTNITDNSSFAPVRRLRRRIRLPHLLILYNPEKYNYIIKDAFNSKIPVISLTKSGGFEMNKSTLNIPIDNEGENALYFFFLYLKQTIKGDKLRKKKRRGAQFKKKKKIRKKKVQSKKVLPPMHIFKMDIR